MGSSVSQSRASTRVDVLDSVRPSPAKAALKVNADQSGLTAVVSDTIRSVTTQKAAAIDMEIDEGQLSRELQTGRLTLARLEKLGPQYAAELGRRLVDAYGSLVSPQAFIREQIREIRRRLDQIEQGVEGLE